MALVGYARVSSADQTLDIQLDKLGHCDRLFQEKQSGVSGNRPGLQACLDYVREEDILVVTRLDRLAISTLDTKTYVSLLALFAYLTDTPYFLIITRDNSQFYRR